jgi:surface protein
MLMLVPVLMAWLPTQTHAQQQSVCFKPTDGFQYDDRGLIRVDRGSVLRNAVVKYVDGDQAVRDTYGQFINDWCIDAVTSLGYIFHNLDTFNEPLSGWNVSGVTSMEGMVRNVAFHLCVCVFPFFPRTAEMQQLTYCYCYYNHKQFRDSPTFNQPIGNWDVSSVTNMDYMVRESIFFGWQGR